MDEVEWDDPTIREMRQYFLVPPPAAELFAAFDGLSGGLPPEYRSAADAFRQNVLSMLSTVAMPFSLASASVEQSHFMRLHIAARIRARSIGAGDIAPGEDLEAVRDREAHHKTVGNMQAFLESERGKAQLSRDISGFLLGAVRHGMGDAAQELLLQGLVLLWSALEVFLRDIFEALLNASPSRVQVLITNPTTRKRFEAEKLPLGILVDHGFDLSQRLGTVLVAQQNFSDLPIVKSVYSALFPSAVAVHEKLGERALWILYQRRHLIVHRRGVADGAYLQNTGEPTTLGSRISIRPKECESDVVLVVAIATEVCRVLPLEKAA